MKTSPMNQNERIEILDIIRGFALFGILFANLASFKTPVFQLQSLPSELVSTPSGLFDQWAVFLIDLFVVGKFYPMFSFLFGLGFYLFYERLRKKSLAPNTMYRRRLLFLLGLGLFHLVFIWTGDILHTYAASGFFLLLFIHRKPKTILLWGCSLIMLSSAILGFLMTLSNLFISMQEGTTFETEAIKIAAAAETVYGSESYLDILQFRLDHEIPAFWFNLFLNLPTVLGLFLLGLYVGKRGFLSQAEKHVSFWKKVQLYTLISGGVLSIVYACMKNGIASLPSWLSSGLAEGLNIQAGPLLMLFYVSTMVILGTQNHRFLQILKPLALVGRMALTNYILQSIVCLYIFYGFGLQLYGKVGAFTGIFIVLFLLAIQTLISWWWLKYFRRGPLETLWRKWTYR